MTRVLVCGGRDYGGAPQRSPAGPRAAQAFGERGIMCRALDDARAQGMATIIQGGAFGADAYARRWAKDHGIACITFNADWAADGKAGGPRRNARMLREGAPDLVIAFPGGKGTADMIRQAQAAGVPVRFAGRTALSASPGKQSDG